MRRAGAGTGALAGMLIGLLFASPGGAADPTPRAGLTPAQLAGFQSGLSLFKQFWFGSRPNNEDQCKDCHHIPVFGGSGHSYNGIVFSAFTFEHASREAGMSRWPESFTDQQAGTGVGQVMHFNNETNPPPTMHNAVSRRVPKGMHGLGSIEQIPQSAILSRADPDDTDRDGISGRPFGRFGSQGQWSSLEQIIRDALVHEIGVAPVNVQAADVSTLASFARGLPDPVEDGVDGEAAADGRQIFSEIGCADCHTPSFQLAGGRTIRPYSDFLVHDMGACLDDGVRVGPAQSYEWRTTPLWGMDSRGSETLHDGRGARPIQNILFHCGEAAASRDAFFRLSATEQAHLRVFMQTMRVR
jgi:CxxC motif-containing protein (DUF1111 family)